MLGAISFDTLAFIALIIIASFFRWISKEAEKAKRKSEQGERSPVQPERVQPGDETDEQRVRRFLEALGQPTSSTPPPIHKRTSVPKEKRVMVPAKRAIFSPLPPLTTVPPPLPVEAEESTLVPVVLVEPAVSRAGLPMISAKEETLPLATFPETAPRGAAYMEVVTLLSSTRGLRDAVILREIFGPPRSMQTIEF